MIKTVIFDIGGVVTHTDFDGALTGFAQRAGISPDIATRYRKTHIGAMMLGHATFTDFCNEMKKAGADASLNFRQVWIEEMIKVRKVDADVLETIAKLRKQFPVGTLTNLTETRLIVDQATGLYDHFDFAIFSCVEHLAKPDPMFYQLALDRAGTKPEEILFIDDNEKCTSGAEKMGMKSILFTTHAALITSLRDFGVNI